MQSITSIPGYQISEYLLVLQPHEELRNRIMSLKNEFAEKYQATSARYLKPHIALVRFVNHDMMEERIVHRLQMISMGIAPFKMELRDYASYPSHTIYINVVSKLPVQQLVKSIKEAQHLLRMNSENKPHFIDEPHLAIARKLKPWQYEKGWLEYSNRHFTGRFIADSMLLLKRREGDKAYQIVKRLEFLNLPVTTTQGSLFM